MRWKSDPDDVEVITGAPAAKAVAGAQGRWYAAVGDAVRSHGGRLEVARSVFNSNMRFLRQRWSTEAIEAGFVRFAEAIEAGTVSVEGKPAWFVFVARREQFIAERSQRSDPWVATDAQRDPWTHSGRRSDPLRDR